MYYHFLNAIALHIRTLYIAGIKERKIIMMKRFLYILEIFIIILCITLTTAIAQNGMAGGTILSLDYALNYASKYGLDVHQFRERNNVLTLIISGNYQQAFVHQIPELLGPDYWGITQEQTDYIYYGEMQNNRPHGLGTLQQIIWKPNSLNHEYALATIYIGNFKKGIFNGYGIKYHVLAPGENYMIGESDLMSNLDGQHFQIYMEQVLNYVEYEGYFEDGEYNGKGILYEYPGVNYQTFMMTANGDISTEYLGSIPFRDLYPDAADYNYKFPGDGPTQHIEILSGNFKNGYADGKCKAYQYGMLYYDGNMGVPLLQKDFCLAWAHGKGTLYFPASSQIRYQGEFGFNSFHGEGTLYDENGKIIYKGKWQASNYAS